MESFSFNAEGVKAATDYLKAQGRYDYIRQIVTSFLPRPRSFCHRILAGNAHQ